MKRLFGRWIAAVALAISTTAALAETRTVDVTVTYRERIALPPDAELELEIADISRADAPSVTLVYSRMSIQRVPMTVTLGTEEDQLDERFTYSVRGRIYSGDTVIFRSDTVTPVFTRDAPDEVTLVLIQGEQPQASNPIAGINWMMFETGGRMFVGDDAPTLVFDTDGSFALYGGCNRFVGKATIGDGTIEFPEAFAGTRMACVPAREGLERSVLNAISNTTGYVRSGDLLTFINEAGVSVLRFRNQNQP
jgi:putative lipoprotein